MMPEELKALPANVKAQLRKKARRQIRTVTQQMLKPQPADRRAYLTGYLTYARTALEALS